ncbi:MAG: hypothetical protein K9H13_12680 [Bacteroidales bacterium]|nr:hypothetical protein [Bacteroidales bacterium]
MAQICINSFEQSLNGKFIRARLENIEDFFEDYHDLDKNDGKLTQIKNVLEIMDEAFDGKAGIISSRAVAVSAYLFSEHLVKINRKNDVKKFASFFESLLLKIKENMNLLNQYETPKNQIILEDFQKYISQASVEAYSIKRRHDFLEKAFSHYLKSSEILS